MRLIGVAGLLKQHSDPQGCEKLQQLPNAHPARVTLDLGNASLVKAYQLAERGLREATRPA